ncbi:hypothetical protein [Oleisolibacter albus]|nr:hypothetical protein [Oleisolibacter albus]
MPAIRHLPQPLGDRLLDRIVATNPDLWLAGALVAVALPWLGRLI